MEIEEPQVRDPCAKLLPTVSNKLDISQILGHSVFLGPDNLIHDHSSQVDSTKSQELLELNLPNLQYIIKNPSSCLSNLKLSNSSLIANEYESVKKGLPKLLLDCTRTENGKNFERVKDLENYGKISACVTYLPNFESLLKNQITNEARIVLSAGRVLNKIVHEAFNQEQSFASLGPISLSKIMVKDSFENLILPGLKKFIAIYKCPLLIDCENEVFTTQILKNLEEVFNKDVYRNRTVLTNYRLPITRETGVENGSGSVKLTQKLSLSQLDGVYPILKAGFNINVPIFKFLREGANIQSICSIIELLYAQDSEKVMISSGIFYKTDLQKYGGIGLSIVEEVINALLQKDNGEELVSKVAKGNAGRVFCWWKTPSKTTFTADDSWICGSCQKEFDSTTKKFSKDGNEFCSPMCFKKYLKLLQK